VVKVSTRFGLVRLSLFLCSHPRITSFLKAVPFEEQVVLAQSSFPPTNSYYPIPAHSPPWVHPSPPSDTTPPSSNSPTSTLANYAGTLPSPSPTSDSLGNNPIIGARSQDVSEEPPELAAQSPPVTTRNPQGTGRRPGACSRCKKLKVYNFVTCLSRRGADDIIEFGRCVVLLGQTRALASDVLLVHTPVSSRGGRRGLRGELLNYHFIDQFDLIRLAIDMQSTREFVEADS
jgi:hypothetical protein